MGSPVQSSRFELPLACLGRPPAVCKLWWGYCGILCGSCFERKRVAVPFFDDTLWAACHLWVRTQPCLATKTHSVSSASHTTALYLAAEQQQLAGSLVLEVDRNVQCERRVWPESKHTVVPMAPCRRAEETACT